MTIVIHKNDLKRYFLNNWRDKTKIGKEKMKRWIDVQEYIKAALIRKISPWFDKRVKGLERKKE